MPRMKRKRDLTLWKQKGALLPCTAPLQTQSKRRCRTPQRSGSKRPWSAPPVLKREMLGKKVPLTVVNSDALRVRLAMQSNFASIAGRPSSWCPAFSEDDVVLETDAEDSSNDEITDSDFERDSLSSMSSDDDDSEDSDNEDHHTLSKYSKESLLHMYHEIAAYLRLRDTRVLLQNNN